MNGALLHLAFNHIPVVGMLFTFLLLAGGLARKSRDIVGAAFAALIVVALFTMVAYKTGGPAARIVHNIPGVTRASIHEHAEAAGDAGTAIMILGGMGILGLWLLKRSGEIPKAWAVITLVCSLITCGWVGWVSHLGGLIRHPEIESNFQPAAPATPETKESAPPTKR